ncbi:hypothetical protein [Mitsuaria sp. GD03876]|uniref:hypothetical protein n=1 Tax=Mitsuaria sp. GD03876 TaxID=2975399 RepID=UPI00244C9A65|nr:hypothetical protein [Mitsuaria sp. GD03876]MDH0864555.1 hypothetical protein [Mitsuaria sp. GD03876]
MIRCVASVPLVAATTCALADGVSRPDERIVIQRTSDAAIIGFEWIDPIGDRLTLIRAGSRLCAVRFSDPVTLNDSSRPSTFSSGDPTRKVDVEISEADWPVDGKAPIWRRRTVTLSMGAMVGLGHWSVLKGKSTIKCGATLFGWMYPRGLGVLDGRAEVSPTAWQSIGDVNLQDKKMAWHLLDSSGNRGWIAVPLEALPGAKTMGRAAATGVSIGVKVFPNFAKPE